MKLGGKATASGLAANVSHHHNLPEAEDREATGSLCTLSLFMHYFPLLVPMIHHCFELLSLLCPAYLGDFFSSFTLTLWLHSVGVDTSWFYPSLFFSFSARDPSIGLVTAAVSALTSTLLGFRSDLH